MASYHNSQTTSMNKQMAKKKQLTFSLSTTEVFFQQSLFWLSFKI